MASSLTRISRPRLGYFNYSICRSWHTNPKYSQVEVTTKKRCVQGEVPHLLCMHVKHSTCPSTFHVFQPIASNPTTCQHNFSQPVPTLNTSVLLSQRVTWNDATSRRSYNNDESKKRPLSPPAPHHDTVLVNLQRLEDSLRYHGYSTIRIGFAVCIVLGISIYIFREAIRENVADEVSQVASRSLDDQLVADKVEEFAKGLLNALLNDQPMHQLASQFVMEVLQRSETRQAMNALVMGVLQDPHTKAQLTATIKQVIITALNEEDTQTIIKSMLKIILSDKETIGAVKNLLGQVFGEAEVKELTATFFSDVLRSELVVDQATKLGKEVTKSVISDPILQEKTSDTIWTAIKYSVTPRWFISSPSSSSDDDHDANVKRDQKEETVMSELEADEESALGG